MKNKTVLVSGATDGIGKQTALELALRGARVLVHGRSRRSGKETVEAIRKRSGNADVHYLHADLSSFGQVNDLAAKVTRKYGELDVLVNNAGVFLREQLFSEDGISRVFAVNHLAHFSLTLQLLPLLLGSPQGRVVTVSSVAHVNSPRIDFSDIEEINSYIDYSAYALSKLANVLFSNELARRLEHTHVTSNSLHPGAVSTKLLHAGFGTTGLDVEEGCKTSVFLAFDDSVTGVSGRYFSKLEETEASALSYDPTVRKNLWQLSEEVCGIRMEDFI
jgi:retinol dehydrogenase 14